MSLGRRPRGDNTPYPSAIDARLERMHRQWMARTLREPGVARRIPARGLLAPSFAFLLDKLRLGPPRPAEVDVFVELAPGAPVPPFVRTKREGDQGPILVGTVDIADLERLGRDRSVLRVEAARRLTLELAGSVSAINAAPATLQAKFPEVAPAYDGSGVIIGILDAGCDFAHKNFRNPDETTRILRLWHQGGGETSKSPPGYGYGVEFSKSEIDAALQGGAPYAALYRPMHLHGSHVMDIAAGNGSGVGSHPGVAPRADLIFVEVNVGDALDSDFVGSSARLVQAAQYVFEQAAVLGRPCVLNMSLGTQGGPHDGTSLVDKALDRFLAEPGRAVVIAAGNSFDADCHATGNLGPGQPQTLTWNVTPDDRTGNEMEIWYSGGPCDVFLRAPGSASEVGPVSVDTILDLQQHGLRGTVIHRGDHPGNGLRHIDIAIDRPFESGAWSVRLANVGPVPVTFDAWIEYESKSAEQSRFSPTQSDTARTLGSLSCGRRPIVVGAYPLDQVAERVCSFSACGKTRDGREKPDVSAPGEHTGEEGILAAEALTGGTIRQSGTSQAAPHVTGAIALMMQASPRPLTIDDIREALIATAKPAPGQALPWDPRAGFGRVDAAAAISNVIGP